MIKNSNHVSFQNTELVEEQFNVPLVETRLHWRKSKRYKTERLDTSQKAALLGKKLLPMYLDREYIFVVACTAKMQPIAIQLVSIGSMNATIFEPARILTFLLLTSAHSFLVFHNHISGDVIPSKEDINATARMSEAAKLVGLNFADHIIIGEGYTSMKEKGYL